MQFECQTSAEQRESLHGQPRWVGAGDLSRLSYCAIHEPDTAPLVTRSRAHHSSLQLNQRERVAPGAPFAPI